MKQVYTEFFESMLALNAFKIFQNVQVLLHLLFALDFCNWLMFQMWYTKVSVGTVNCSFFALSFCLFVAFGGLKFFSRPKM